MGRQHSRTVAQDDGAFEVIVERLPRVLKDICLDYAASLHHYTLWKQKVLVYVPRLREWPVEWSSQYYPRMSLEKAHFLFETKTPLNERELPMRIASPPSVFSSNIDLQAINIIGTPIYFVGQQTIVT